MNDTAILIVYKKDSDKIDFIQVGSRDYLADNFKKYIGRATISVYRIGKERVFTKKQIYTIFKSWFYNFIADEGSEPSGNYIGEALRSFKKEIKIYEKEPYKDLFKYL